LKYIYAILKNRLSLIDMYYLKQKNQEIHVSVTLLYA